MPPPPKVTVLVEHLNLPAGESRAVTFTAPPPGKGREPYLSFLAAAESTKAGGYCNRAIRVLVNGKPFDTDRLSNRPPLATMMNGHVLTVAQGDGCLLIPLGARLHRHRQGPYLRAHRRRQSMRVRVVSRRAAQREREHDHVREQERRRAGLHGLAWAMSNSASAIRRPPPRPSRRHRRGNSR